MKLRDRQHSPLDSMTDNIITSDSMIRSGVEIAKVLALGTFCALIGPLCVFGPTNDRQSGVEHVFWSLLSDLDMTLL